MAGTSIVVDLLLRARDLASAPLRGVVATAKFLDSEISVIAGKIRNAMAGLFGGGLDGAMEFEAQLSKVAAKGGFTAEEMAKLKQAATDIGARFGVTGTEAAQGMEALAAAGLNATQVMQALPPVLALAKAEGISMDAAAEKLSDSLSTVGLGFDQAARMADVLAKGANLSTTSATALAGALATAGGIAKTAGLNLEQTVAALSALANAGIKGEKAGTALQAILTQLVNPASQASRELSALGITSRDLGTVIGQLATKGDVGNAAILAFGETAGPGLRALIGQGQQALDGLTGQLANSKGAAEEAATGINSNLKGALSALQSAWENVKTALFDPVLEPLTKQARELASTLNANLASGALKPVQAAIRAFADNAVQAARDVVSGFDFKIALKNVQDFAAGSEQAFAELRDSGKTAVDVISLSWNTLASGFRTIGATLLETAASAVATLANMEEAASKIGLGSQQRANELRETAIGLESKAAEIIAGVNANSEKMGQAFTNLTASTKKAAEESGKLADAQQAIKDSSPAQELQDITRSLADYQGMAARANAAAARARQEYESGKISAAQYGQALMAASDANAELAAATQRQTEAAKQASPQREQTATELASAAASAQDAADSQRDYTSAIEQAGSAQAAALQAEIALARAKNDTAAAVQKNAELARLEADTAAKVAAAKQTEVTEMEKAVRAQEAYLAALGGGTQAQRQALDVLRLKLDALKSDAQQAQIAAQQNEMLAQQAERMAGPIGQLIRLYEQKAVAAERETDAVARGFDAKLRELDVEQRQTEAKGDTIKTAELGVKIKETEIEQAQAAAAAKTAELQAQIDLLEANKLDVLASEQNAQAKAEELAAIDAKIAKLKDLQNAERDRAEATKTELETAKRSAEALKAQAQAAADTERETRRMAAIVGHAAENFGQLNEKGQAALAALKTDPLLKAAQNADSLTRSTIQLTKALDDQAGSEIRFAQRLAELQTAAAGVGPAADHARQQLLSMAQSGTAGISGITSAGQSAIQTLEGIRNAALQAEQALGQMSDDYQRQILQAQGNQRQLLELEHQDNLQRLEELHQRAGQLGGDEYAQAKARAEQLHALKLRQLEEEEAAKRRQNVVATNEPSPSRTSGATAGAPARVYQLNLAGANGRNFTAFSENDPSAFLDELEAAKRRSLQ